MEEICTGWSDELWEESYRLAEPLAKTRLTKKAVPKIPQGNTRGGTMVGTVPFSQNAPRRGRGRASASVSHPPLQGDSVETSFEKEESMEVGPDELALEGLDRSEVPRSRGGSSPVDQTTVVRPETPLEGGPLDPASMVVRQSVVQAGAATRQVDVGVHPPLRAPVGLPLARGRDPRTSQRLVTAAPGGSTPSELVQMFQSLKDYVRQELQMVRQQPYSNILDTSEGAPYGGPPGVESYGEEGDPGSGASVSDLDVDLPPCSGFQGHQDRENLDRAFFSGSSEMTQGRRWSGAERFPHHRDGGGQVHSDQQVRVDSEGVQWVRKVPARPSSTHGSDPNQMSESIRRASNLVQAVAALRKVFQEEGPLQLPPPPPPMERQSTESFTSMRRTEGPEDLYASAGLPWSPRFLTSAAITQRVAQGGKWIPPMWNVEDSSPGFGNLLKTSHKWESRYEIVPGPSSVGAVRPSPAHQLSDPATPNFCRSSALSVEASVPYSLSPTETVKMDKASRTSLRPINAIDYFDCGLDAVLVALTGEQDEDARLHLLGQARTLLLGLRTANLDLMQGQMAVVAAFSAVRKEAVLSSCAFTQVNTQAEKHDLRRSDWRSPLLFDGKLAEVCDRLARVTSTLVNRVTADTQAKQRRTRPPAAAGVAATRRPPPTAPNTSRPGKPYGQRPRPAGGAPGKSF
jgi:hypothetical protein